MNTNDCVTQLMRAEYDISRLLTDLEAKNKLITELQATMNVNFNNRKHKNLITNSQLKKLHMKSIQNQNKLMKWNNWETRLGQNNRNGIEYSRKNHDPKLFFNNNSYDTVYSRVNN
jgi:hypothetical protein